MTTNVATGALRRLAYDSLVFITGNLTGAALGFALSLVIGRGLGDDSLGQWTFSMAWASALTALADFGQNMLVMREAARLKTRANQLLTASLTAKLGCACLLSGVAWLASPYLGKAPAVAILPFALPLVVTGTAYGAFIAIFRVFDWMMPMLWLNTGGLLLQVMGSVWSLQRGGDVIQLVVIANLVQAVRLALAAGIWWSKLRPLGGAIWPDWREIGRIFFSSFPFAVAGILETLRAEASVLVLGYFRSQAEVGWFGAASRFSEAVKLVPGGVFGAAYVLFSTGVGNGAHRSDERLMRIYSRSLLVFALMAAAGLAVSADFILRLTYGPEFAPAARTLVLLSLGLVPTLVNSGMEVYLYATKEEAYANRLSALALAVQAATSLPLAATLGAPGVAIGLGLSETVIWFPLWRRVQQVRQGNHTLRMENPTR